jgi:hypothetical protein
MADSKGTRSRKRKKAVRFSHLLKFPEVKGKTIDEVELDPEAQAIVILFQDNTALSFDLDPGLGVFPELSDRRDGSLKRWKPLHTPSSILKWL